MFEGGDQFHIQKLACEAIQQMRIALRWDAINEETNAIENVRQNDRKYTSQK